MKMKNLGMAALFILGLVAISAFAMGMNSFGNEDVKAAIEANDYKAFIQALETSDKARIESITEEKFSNMVERYKQKKSWMESRDKIEQSIQNNDYNAWSEAMNAFIESQKSQITKENFDRIVQMHGEMQNNNSTMMHMGMGHGFPRGQSWHTDIDKEI